MVSTRVHYCRNIVRVWWLLYADHRAVFEVRRNCFIRRNRSVSEGVGCFAYAGRSEDRELPGLAMRVIHAS